MRSQSTRRTWIGTEAQVVRHVRVCGEGHLATATRIELERQGIHRDTDYLLPSLRPALVIACADSEADQYLNDAAQQALDEGSPLLLCCLAGPVVRLGPLIDPNGCFASAAARSQPAPDPTSPPASALRPTMQPAPAPTSPARPAPPTASLSPFTASPAAPASSPALPASARPARPQSSELPHRPQSPARPAGDAQALHPDARLAALLVTTQALNFLLGARNQCVLDRVVELNPCSMESTGYRVFHN